MAHPSQPAAANERPSAPSSSSPSAPGEILDPPLATQHLEGVNIDGVKVQASNDASNATQNSEEPARSDIPKAIAWRLYISHFLSTWNSRSFEFGAVLFLASIFPMTLMPLSIYALVRSFSAICFAPLIGRLIDRQKRLAVGGVVAGRLAVVISCVGFWGLETYRAIPSSTRWAVFSMVTLLSCVEKPCSVLNLVAVERDWAIVIAENNDRRLQALNARMRRIDLFCKLVGPLFIALIDGASTKIAIFTTLAMNILSVPIEYVAITQVYNVVPLLKVPKTLPTIGIEAEASESRPSTFPRFIPRWLDNLYQIFEFYFKHSAMLPSFVLSLLYLTVLSFGGQMVTYLISAGYNSFIIALVRTVSVVFELSSTWIAPRLMKRILPARAGMWFLGWQMSWLGAAVIFFWSEPRPIVAASGLVVGTIFSRIGLWGYDLCAQFIVQEEVQGNSRGSFSSTEASLQNAFELLSYVFTIIWSRPAQFRYPVLISAAATYLAGFLFGKFLRQRRGHLIHTPECIKRAKPDDVEFRTASRRL